MIKYTYAYFNKLGGFFGNPFYSDIEKDHFKEYLFQSLFAAKKEELAEISECELYYLGEFDNVSSEIKYEKEFLLNCSSVCEEILSKKEASTDEKC